MRNKGAESPIRIERAEQTLNGPAQLLDWRRNVKAIVDCGTLPPLYPSVCVGSTRTFPYDELLFSKISNGPTVRCGEIGHQARDCRNRQLYYCWRCGKRGIKTTECCGLASGNGQRPYLPQDQVRAAADLSREQTQSSRPNRPLCTVCKALVATVQLGDSCACIPFLVLSTVVDDVILGIDFLCAIRASLHCGPVQLQLTPACLQTPT
ncbi:hypothetical protein ACLKA6_000621 [Drosophila palustris]